MYEEFFFMLVRKTWISVLELLIVVVKGCLFIVQTSMLVPHCRDGIANVLAKDQIAQVAIVSQMSYCLENGGAILYSLRINIIVRSRFFL